MERKLSTDTDAELFVPGGSVILDHVTSDTVVLLPHITTIAVYTQYQRRRIRVAR